MPQQMTATVTNTGRVWVVSVEGIDGTTLVRSPSHAGSMAAELAALHNGGSPTDYDIVVHVDMPERWRGQWAQVQEHRAEASRHRDAWRRGAHELVSAMREDGLSQADVAASLGVSVQTVRTWESLELDVQGEQ
ncbi:DNA-binding transcriptional regulator [uncultured Brachybacterium sp.]|uniref:helix-turn-helix domain-containing protein n=1 Tax=uncultured Brachybacterium sp. TaxID=189680 RepID=UPI0026293006|nr:hypothetical protein [uncultured Brachybacterium sp.]